MKALVYTQPNEMQIMDRPYPSLDKEEVVLVAEGILAAVQDLVEVLEARAQTLEYPCHQALFIEILCQ